MIYRVSCDIKAGPTGTGSLRLMSAHTGLGRLRPAQWRKAVPEKSVIF